MGGIARDSIGDGWLDGDGDAIAEFESFSACLFRCDIGGDDGPFLAVGCTDGGSAPDAAGRRPSFAACTGAWHRRTDCGTEFFSS